MFEVFPNVTEKWRRLHWVWLSLMTFMLFFLCYSSPSWPGWVLGKPPENSLEKNFKDMSLGEWRETRRQTKNHCCSEDSVLLCIHEEALVWRSSSTDTKAKRLFLFVARFKQITMMQKKGGSPSECEMYFLNWPHSGFARASQQPGRAQY